MPPELRTPLTPFVRSDRRAPELPSGQALPRVPEADHGGELVAMVMAALRELPALLPWIFPPGSALPFSQPLVNTPQNINAGQILTLVTYQVPQGSRGRISHVGVAGSDLANLRWTIFCNGNPVPPIAGLIVEYGTIASPTAIPGPGVLLLPEVAVELQVENVGGAVIADVQGRLDGYLWRADR